MDIDDGNSFPSTNANIPILTLEQTEVALIQLLSLASDTVNTLVSIDSTKVNQAEQYINNYYSTLAQIKQSLLYHINHLPVSRNYKLTHYADYTQFELEDQKLQLLLQSLQNQNNNITNTSTNINSENKK